VAQLDARNPMRGNRISQSTPAAPHLGELKWTEADFVAAADGQLPMGSDRL
jgi:hypothetical protein